MNPKGNVWINKEFVHTTQWPTSEMPTMHGIMNLEKEYKEALAGKLVTVLDIAVDDSGYLVLGEGKNVGQFIWQIEKGDTKGFIPVIKKNGVLIPAGLNPLEEMVEIVKGQTIQMRGHNDREMDRIRREWWKTCDLPRKAKKRKRKALLIEFSLFSWMDDYFFADTDWDLFQAILKKETTFK